MKKLIIFLLAFFFVSNIHSQLCPGGGTSFSSAVTFVQSWTSACASGTSCTGGTEFDNRSGCEPTTTMDACAPTPSCTTPANNGSDLWYKFYAAGTTAVIHVIQNVSFIAVIQAFSGGPTCGSLTEIGCVVAAGPSSGVTLNLSGLTTGNAYYFRVFGTASSAAQRTGTFCFCGSSGLGSLGILPVQLSSFKAVVQDNKIKLLWATGMELNNNHFEIERSTDGQNFIGIGFVAAKGSGDRSSEYLFTDTNPAGGTNYYRLKQVDMDNHFEYSNVIPVKAGSCNWISIFPNPVKGKLIIQSSSDGNAMLTNEFGQVLQRINLVTGRNEIPVAKLNSGTYFILGKNFVVQRFHIIH